MATSNAEQPITHSIVSREVKLAEEGTTAVTANPDTATILQKLAETLARAVDVTSVYILNWHPATGKATVVADYISDQASPNEKKSDKGATYDLNEMIGSAVHTVHQSATLVFRQTDSNLTAAKREHMQLFDGQTTLLLPIIVQGQILGFADLWESRRPRHFSQKEIELCQDIVSQAALALDIVGNYQEESRRRRGTEIVQEVATMLAATYDVDEILSRVIDAVRLYLPDIQTCSLSILEDKGTFLRIRANWSARPEYDLYPVGSGVLVEETLASRLIISTKEPMAVADLRQMPFINERIAHHIRHGLQSILYVPLLIHTKILGIMHISAWERQRHFSDDEIAFCQGLANQAAIVLENANLFSEQQRQLHLLQVLQQVGSLMTTRLSLQAVFEKIFDLLAQVISFNAVSIMLLDDENSALWSAASRGLFNLDRVQMFIQEQREHILAKIPSPPGWRVISDTKNDPDWIFVPDAVNARSWIGAALRVQDRIIGVLNVDSLQAGAYDEETAQMVAVFANQAAIAIENTRLYEESKLQAEELSILHQLGQTTAVTLDVDTLLQQTTDLIAAKFYPNLFAFLLLDSSATTYQVHPSARGVPEVFLGKEHSVQQNSILNQVVQTGRPYWTNDVQQDPFYYEVNPLTRSEISVPLKMRDAIIGVLDVESPQRDAFTERDVHFLTTLAANVTAVIERAGLYQELQAQAADLARQVKQQTAELQMERDRIAAILDNAGEGIVLLDPEGRLLFTNPAFLRQTGYRKEELLQQSAFKLVSSDTSQKTIRDLIRTVRSNALWSGELKNQHKNGAIYDVAVTVASILNEKSEIAGYVAVQTDISRAKELERLKVQFISNISHDLRTPLTNIKTYLSLLERGKPEKRPRYFQILHQESDRLARLIEHLLDISRLDSEFKPDKEAAVPVERLWRNLQERYIDRVRPLSVTMLWQADGNTLVALPDLQIAEHHALKVMEHLLDNALAYSHPDGTIKISVGSENTQMVWFRVEDNGPGIALEDKPFIFDRFYRGALARDKNVSGTGLGLAIVHSIVDHYNGRIAWDSQPDQQTWFTVWLPTVQTE